MNDTVTLSREKYNRLVKAASMANSTLSFLLGGGLDVSKTLYAEIEDRQAFLQDQLLFSEMDYIKHDN